MKIENGLPLVRFEPMVSRNESVVLVDLAESFLPVVKLARRDADPGDDLPLRDLGLLGPTANVITDLVARLMGNPNSG
jgi:hypothetical protein